MPALQAVTGNARLMLGRFRMTARVPRDRIAAGEVVVNAGAFFADHVAPALKDVLAPLMDSGDPSVWIIRRLDVKILSDRASGHNGNRPCFRPLVPPGHDPRLQWRGQSCGDPLP